MPNTIDTLLLLALPASGKSEVRRYLAHVDPEVAAAEFGLGPTVQLDDYPYVHFMRRIGEEARRLEAQPVFFASDDRPFLDGRDWATLIELVNEDYADLGTTPAVPASPAAWLLGRLDRARRAVGAPPPFDQLPEATIAAIEASLDDEAAEFARERSAELASYQPGESTVVIEFARGGPEMTKPPLNDPYGYQYSLRHLSPDILRRASILYVWVSPEESRRRNDERARPGREGDASILHHGVPESVMRGDYGTDDFTWLLEQGRGRTLPITANRVDYQLPAAIFDNRADHTSFLRAASREWDTADVDVVHTELAKAFDRLHSR